MIVSMPAHQENLFAGNRLDLFIISFIIWSEISR